MQALLPESTAPIRQLIYAMFLSVAFFIVTSEGASAQEPVMTVAGVIVDEVTIQTDGYPTRVVTLNADDGTVYTVATVGGYTPEGDYLVASHSARLPFGYKVEVELAPAPEARMADLYAGGYAPAQGEIVYQVDGAEDGEVILYKDEGVTGDGTRVASAALRASYDDFELHWETFPVPFYLNTNGGPISASKQIDAAKQAVQMWNTITCSELRVRFAGTTSMAGNRTADNGLNMLYWDADYFVKSGHPFRLGETWRRFNTTSWALTDVEIVLNAGQKFAYPGTYSTYDVGITMAHEIGHGLGFKHVTGNDNFMNGYLSMGTTIRSLGQFDADQVHYLYPGTCNGAPVVSSKVAVARIACFGPSGANSDEYEIIVEDSDDAGRASGMNPDPIDPGGGDDTASDPTDMAIPPPSPPPPEPPPAPPPAGMQAGFVETTQQDALRQEVPLEGTALAISALSSEDSSASYQAWDGVYWDEGDWDSNLEELVTNWFVFSPD